MSRRIYVSLLPSLLDASRLAGGSAVVIDLLRASSTICAALASGVERIYPLATVEDARRMADTLAETGERPLLGGERAGVRIDGFDLGNSPLEYTREAVAGKTLLFTTTNGTRALLAAAPAERIYVGAFANLSTLADHLAAESGDVHFVCAGTDNQVTLEDIVCAGAIAAALRQRVPGFVVGNDEATVALALHLGFHDDRTRLEALRSSLGGRNLVELGYDRDIDYAARLDVAPVLPLLTDGALTNASPAPASGTDDEFAI